MRRIPWWLSVRYTRKGAITVLGIALGVAFALVSFSIAKGLERDTLEIARNHPESSLTFSAPGGEPFEMSRLAAHPSAIGVILAEATNDRGHAVVVVALVGPRAPPVTDGVARPGSTDETSRSILVDGMTLEVGEPMTHRAIPAGWYHVPVESITGDPSVVHFAIIPDPSTNAARDLQDAGFVVSGAPALELFFRSSGVEIARDLLLVVVFASVLSMLFCYEFLRSEVREARREIGIWRAVGMRSKDVVALFLARAAAVGVFALVIGWGFSAVLLGLAFQRTGIETLRFALGPVEAIALSTAFVLATVAGGVIPAFLAGKISVSQALEAAP